MSDLGRSCRASRPYRASACSSRPPKGLIPLRGISGRPGAHEDQSYRSWSSAGSWRIQPVPSRSRNARSRVDLTRSPRRRRTGASCAQRPSTASSSLGGNPPCARSAAGLDGRGACPAHADRVPNDNSKKRGEIFAGKSGGPFPAEATRARNFWPPQINLRWSPRRGLSRSATELTYAQGKRRSVSCCLVPRTVANRE